ncbi:site-specific integrase [Mangrovicoccus sp. HB161399]|uniref:tyrosine-type recombinase/integrase n=1 Tax=Mangrovicoccus sp. HB161399 TaxID=2720392 RepID=UPI0020A6978F|nr:site-specific integrase [Mangrovicoccus sp. HB161399]
MTIKTLPDGTHEDGNGLRLVRKGGRGKWVWRYSFLGKRHEMGLGAQDNVSLAEARKARDRWRSVLAEGRNPVAERRAEAEETKRKRERNDPTIAELVDLVFEARKETLRGDGKRGQWRNALDLYLIPAIGKRAGSTITAQDIADAVRPIWRTKHPTGVKLMIRTRLVLKDGRAMGFPVDPAMADRAKVILGAVDHQPKHIEATPWQEMPALFERAGCDTMAGLCIRFGMLTIVRSAAFRGALKSEIDGDVWTVPADRIKGTRGRVKDFRVPLSSAALELIEPLMDIPGNALFPGQRARTLTDMALSGRLNKIGEAGRLHGFRTAFRTWVQDTDACGYEVAETVLGHTIGGAVERAYARSDLLDRRRPVMEAWGRFVTGQAAAAVLPFAK